MTTRNLPSRGLVKIIPAVLLSALAAAGSPGGKEKQVPVDPNDSTLQLFQLLDSSHNGKLTDFYILGDTFTGKDSNGQPAELQHVIMVDYDKTRAFGRLNVHVRSVSKLAPEQLKTYTTKQIFDFGVEDTEKFAKTDPGPLGKVGDVYVTITDDGRLTTAPITEEARKQYDFLVNQYVIPALKNTDAPATGTVAKQQN